MSSDLNAAIAAASSEAVTELGGEPEAKVEATPAAEASDAPKAEEKVEAATETPKEEPAKAEAKPAEEEVDFRLSANDLAKINESPELRKAYRSMVKGFTQKTQALAETRKTLEEKAKVADWIQSDPDGAVETLARLRGKTFQQAKVEAADKVTDGLEAKWAETVGPDAAKLLRPLFEETARQMLQTVVDPLRQQTEQLSRAAAERGIAAAVAEFGAKRAEADEEWNDEVQAEMAKLMSRVDPGDEADIQDYLSTIYDAVAARRMRSKGVKSQLERLRAAKESGEPTQTSRPAPKNTERITDDMDDRTAIALAVKQAQEQFAH